MIEGALKGSVDLLVSRDPERSAGERVGAQSDTLRWRVTANSERALNDL